MAFGRRLVSKQLGELLVERGIITSAQCSRALQVQSEKGRLLGQIIVELGYATEEQIAQVLTAQYGFPYLPLENYEVSPDAIKLIPENVARQYCLVPLDKIGTSITIAMANPLNQQAIEDIEMLTNLRTHIFVSTVTDINKAIAKYYGVAERTHN